MPHPHPNPGHDLKEYQVRITVHGSKTVLKRVVENLYSAARSGRTKAGCTVTRFKAGDIEKVQGSVFAVPISFRRYAAAELNLKRDIRRALGAQSIVQNDTEPWLGLEPIIRER